MYVEMHFAAGAVLAAAFALAVLDILAAEREWRIFTGIVIAFLAAILWYLLLQIGVYYTDTRILRGQVAFVYAVSANIALLALTLIAAVYAVGQFVTRKPARLKYGIAFVASLLLLSCTSTWLSM
jgi:hypothetical protein